MRRVEQGAARGGYALDWPGTNERSLENSEEKDESFQWVMDSVACQGVQDTVFALGKARAIMLLECPQ